MKNKIMKMMKRMKMKLIMKIKYNRLKKIYLIIIYNKNYFNKMKK